MSNSRNVIQSLQNSLESESSCGLGNRDKMEAMSTIFENNNAYSLDYLELPRTEQYVERFSRPMNDDSGSTDSTDSECATTGAAVSLNVPIPLTRSRLDPNSKPFSPRSSELTTASSFDQGNISPTSFQGSVASEDIFDIERASSTNGLPPTGPPQLPPSGPSLPLPPIASNPRPLLPTPSDFPPFGHIGRVRPRLLHPLEDRYGLRALARSIEDAKALEELDLRFKSTLDLIRHPEHRLNQLETPFQRTGLHPMADCYDNPEEYFHAYSLADRLPAPLEQQWNTDLLFYLFYTSTGDALQMVAANQLHDRGWRFHKQLGIWLARLPNYPPVTRTESYEKGYYQYHCVRTWSRVGGTFILKYQDLAEKVTLPVGLREFYKFAQAQSARMARRRKEMEMKHKLQLQQQHMMQMQALGSSNPNVNAAAAAAAMAQMNRIQAN